MSTVGSFISHDAAASLLQVAPDELTRLVGAGLVRRAAPGKYSPAQIIRDYISHLQREPDRRERAPTQAEIAAHLDMSERNLRDLLEQLGITHTKSTLAEIRIAYVRRLREQAAGRLGSEGGLDLVQERAALAREQRLSIEIKNALLRGEYAPVALLGEVLAMASQAVAERFEQLPGQLRKTCPDLPTAAVDQVMSGIASARNEWVKSTAALVAAAVASVDDEDDMVPLEVEDEPRAV